jgi:GT2 family glycosyltransferase
LLLSYPQVRFIHNQTNVGFAVANNQAITLILDSEWVALLNPDAFPEPDWLEQLVAAVAINLNYSSYASRKLRDDDFSLLDGNGDIYHISGLVWRDGHGQRVEEAMDQSREIFPPCAAAVLSRREAFLLAGGFDEGFFCYVEDVDLGFRLQLLGHRCQLVPKAVIHHIGSATSGGQHSDFALYPGHRNLVWSFIKNMPGSLFWALLSIHLALNLISIVCFSLHGHGKVICTAK